MNQNVRKVTEGAMIVAIYGIFLFFNLQLGNMLEYNFLFALPIPMIIYTTRHGFKNSIVVATSVILLTFMISLIQTWFYVGSSLILGITYGMMVRSKKSSGFILIVAIMISTLVDLLVSVVFASFFGFDVAMLMQEYETMLNMMIQGQTLPVDMGQFIILILVFGIIFTGIMEGLLIHFVSYIILKRLKISVPPIKPMSIWKRSKKMGYISFIIFSCGLLLNYVKINETATLVFMFFYILATAYLIVYGYLAIVLFGRVCYNKNFAWYIVLGLVFLNAIMLYMLTITGFIYLTTDMYERILSRRNVNG